MVDVIERHRFNVIQTYVDNITGLIGFVFQQQADDEMALFRARRRHAAHEVTSELGARTHRDSNAWVLEIGALSVFFENAQPMLDDGMR